MVSGVERSLFSIKFRYAAQIALAWVLHQENVIVIPKSSRIDHIEQNFAALNLKLSADELATLDAAFPPSTKPVLLEML
ncbi:aldo/keto reductase [Argonema antarcticum]|uniref:aldo/keto reductase n=1 Tax=Argonema antarcticum TaxID=2942763 RepID=UPI002011954F|nr:aldo/keto reductase [Argonema antarcticum A004/B2]